MLARASLAFLFFAFGCATDTEVSDDAVDQGDGKADGNGSSRTKFQSIVEAKGNIFNVFCADAETDEFAFRVRAFYQPDLYTQGQLDRTQTQTGFASDPEFRGFSVVPTDSPKFFTVRNNFNPATHIVFERTPDGMIGSGLLRGVEGAWTCTVWATSWSDDLDAFRPWRRAL